ncbi:MAG: hypothetical protein Q7U57_06055 [Methylovulum sp.]|nr:hypothetical protein [Methylovulum sp.]
MKTLRNTLNILLATGAIVTATSASALPQDWGDYLPAWTATASSCSVDESSTAKHEFSGTQFRYLGANVSNFGVFVSNVAASGNSAVITRPNPTYQPITVRCNVTPIYDYVPAIPAAPGDLFGTPAYWKSADWNALIVGYKDTDGISTKAQVSASLRKVNRATLGESTIATFNSNTSASVVANEDIKQFTHTFDFQNNEYYVEINLIRADTTVATPVAYSVRLAKGEFGVILH